MCRTNVVTSCLFIWTVKAWKGQSNVEIEWVRHKTLSFSTFLCCSAKSISERSKMGFHFRFEEIKIANMNVFEFVFDSNWKKIEHFQWRGTGSWWKIFQKRKFIMCSFFVCISMIVQTKFVIFGVTENWKIKILSWIYYYWQYPAMIFSYFRLFVDHFDTWKYEKIKREENNQCRLSSRLIYWNLCKWMAFRSFSFSLLLFAYGAIANNERNQISLKFSQLHFFFTEH